MPRKIMTFSVSETRLRRGLAVLPGLVLTLALTWRGPVELLPAYAVGSLGAFWQIQRRVAI